MIGQVLNREVVQAQLPRLADTLAQLEDGKEAVPNELGHLSKADLERARKALLGKADKPVPAEPPEAGDRRAVIAPVDDFAFIPRDAITEHRPVRDRGGDPHADPGRHRPGRARRLRTTRRRERYPP